MGVQQVWQILAQKSHNQKGERVKHVAVTAELGWWLCRGSVGSMTQCGHTWMTVSLLSYEHLDD